MMLSTILVLLQKILIEKFIEDFFFKKVSKNTGNIKFVNELNIRHRRKKSRDKMPSSRNFRVFIVVMIVTYLTMKRQM